MANERGNGASTNETFVNHAEYIEEETLKQARLFSSFLETSSSFDDEEDGSRVRMDVLLRWQRWLTAARAVSFAFTRELGRRISCT